MFLLSTIRGRERDLRINAFVAVGLVAIAVEDHTKPYLARILDVIRTSLPPKVLLLLLCDKNLPLLTVNYILFIYYYRTELQEKNL